MFFLIIGFEYAVGVVEFYRVVRVYIPRRIFTSQGVDLKFLR